MTAAVLNISIEQGTTYRNKVTLKDALEVPINITGCTFRGAIKKTPGTPVLSTFSFTDDAGTGNPLDDADPALGEIFMVLSPEQSSLLPFTGASSYLSTATFQYDAEMLDTNGNVFRILNGKVIVSPEITT